MLFPDRPGFICQNILRFFQQPSPVRPAICSARLREGIKRISYSGNKDMKDRLPLLTWNRFGAAVQGELNKPLFHSVENSPGNSLVLMAAANPAFLTVGDAIMAWISKPSSASSSDTDILPIFPSLPVSIFPY